MIQQPDAQTNNSKDLKGHNPSDKPAKLPLPIGANIDQHPTGRGGWDWPVVIGLGAMHVFSLAAPWTFSWTGLGWMVLLWYVTAGLGITLAYHRLLTHRSFACPTWLESALTFCACLAWQGKPTQWVGTHRLHHKHSDTDHDPHTPEHGFTWAHVTWTLMLEPEGMKADDAAKDLLRKPNIAFLNRFFVWPQFIVAVLLTAVGFAIGYFTAESAAVATQAGMKLALSWFVWGVAVRTVLTWHVTWFVNSAAHTWGYRNFETKEHSTNLWWVALLSFGEGWHNNHHAQQRSAAHGMRWWEIDLTYYTIKLLEKLGLAWNVVEPDMSKMERFKNQPEAQAAEEAASSLDIRIKPITDAASAASAATAAAAMKAKESVEKTVEKTVEKSVEQIAKPSSAR